VIAPSHCTAIAGTYLGPGSSCAACVVGPCSGQPNGTPCDDANACTTGDVCTAGSCVGTPASTRITQPFFVSKAIPPPEPDFNAQIFWIHPSAIDAIRGSLNQLKATQSFTPSVQTCLLNDFVGSGQSEPGTVPPNNCAYYLLRPVMPPGCSQQASYSTGSPKERAGRDAEINANPSACP